MAVGVILEFSGASLDQYDEAMKIMEFTPGGPTPPGALFHWVAATDDGFRVVDVWESQEQFDKFAQEKIGPTTASIGMTTPPVVTISQVHNYLSA